MLLSTKALLLFTASLNDKHVVIKVLLELGSALDNYLETRILTDLNLLDLDVAISREHIDHLSQLGHADIAVAVKLELFVLVLVENVLDDTDVLASWQAHSNRHHVRQVLFSFLARLVLSTLRLLLGLVTALLLARSRRLLGIISSSAILAVASVVALAAARVSSRGGFSGNVGAGLRRLSRLSSCGLGGSLGLGLRGGCDRCGSHGFGKDL